MQDKDAADLHISKNRLHISLKWWFENRISCKLKIWHEEDRKLQQCQHQASTTIRRSPVHLQYGFPLRGIWFMQELYRFTAATTTVATAEKDNKDCLALDWAI
jgi:hypothetical protein